MPNEFSGQIVVEKDGFKEIHIIKDGKAIQKYNVRVYPDGREVSVDDEFAVVAVQDGQKVTKGLLPLNVCVCIFLWSLPSHVNVECEEHHLLP